jgi:hypothetical protein
VIQQPLRVPVNDDFFAPGQIKIESQHVAGHRAAVGMRRIENKPGAVDARISAAPAARWWRSSFG